MYVQLVPFRLRDGVDEAALLAASDRFEVDFVAAQVGIDRRVLLRGSDGVYADLVFFGDRAAADRVAAAEATSEACAAFSSLMGPPVEGAANEVWSFDGLRDYESGAESVLECVVFGPAGGVTRDVFVAAAAGINDWVRSQPGFVSRALFEVGDGRWIDLVRWTTMDAALAAADAATRSESCGRFFGLIDMANVVLLHGSPVLPFVRA